MRITAKEMRDKAICKIGSEFLLDRIFEQIELRASQGYFTIRLHDLVNFSSWLSDNQRKAIFTDNETSAEIRKALDKLGFKVSFDPEICKFNISW